MIPVDQLSAWIPHRGRAIWIDEVVSGGPDGGECLVRLDSNAPYAQGGELRPSALIEWMAQAFGYSCASFQMGLKPEEAQHLNKAFLVAVRGFKLEPEFVNCKRIRPGEILRVITHKTHQLGPIAIISGKVLAANGVLLGKAELKVFAESALPP